LISMSLPQIAGSRPYPKGLRRDHCRAPEG
jgi:hypothetical protein